MQLYAGWPSQGSRPIGRRLAVRGLKLLAIFTILNLAARLAWQRNHYGAELDVMEFLHNWFDVYVTAHAKGIAFDVLVPITYTIWLAIGVIALRETRRWTPLVLAVSVFATCVVLDATGRAINNLSFISAGMIGLWIGTRILPTSIGSRTRGRWWSSWGSGMWPSRGQARRATRATST